MRDQILGAPDFGTLQITFDAPGERIVAESGAMVAMSTGIDIQTNMRGGLLAAAKRKVLGGESLFQNTYTSTQPGQLLYLAGPAEGDLRRMDLAPNQSFFSGVGFFMLRMVGPGTVYYSTYGAIHEVAIGQYGYTADTGHIVGFSEGVNYNVRAFGGVKGLFFSGEGLVCDLYGQGSVLIQTRNPTSLASFLHPFRPVKRKG